MSADREMMMMFQGAPAPPLEDDNILLMILLRLPPLPSSLPRASLVCKRWHRLVTDPDFHRNFLAHHKKAPLLGFFCSDYDGRMEFRATMDPPNRIPAARLSSCPLIDDNIILECHHGRLLLLNFSSSEQQDLVVWDPITGDHHHVEIPQMFQGYGTLGRKGVVVCASREKDHVHGACHLEPFQVVLIDCSEEVVVACVYSSETSTWGNLISLSQQQLILTVPAYSQSSVVGNSIYWVAVGVRDAVLEFDFHRQTLAIIDSPLDAYYFNACIHQDYQSFIMPADGGGLSFIVLSGLRVHVWKRISSNGHGVAGWLFEKTVQLSNLFSLKPRVEGINIQGTFSILGCDEDGNVIFRLKDSGIVYLVHLKTMHFKELSGKIGNMILAQPFSSFYTAGMRPGIGMRGDKNV